MDPRCASLYLICAQRPALYFELVERKTVTMLRAASRCATDAATASVRRSATRAGRLKHLLPPTRCASTSTSSTPSSHAGPRVAYGALAGVAFFSAVLGYSVAEWKRRGAFGTKEAKGEAGNARTWEDVQYGSHADVEAAIGELRKILPRDGAVNTVRLFLMMLRGKY